MNGINGENGTRAVQQRRRDADAVPTLDAINFRGRDTR